MSTKDVTRDAEATPADNEEIIVDITDQTEPERQMTALQVLLSAKPVRQSAKLRIRKRDGLPQDLVLTIKSLTDSEFKSIGEQAEQPTGSRNDRRRAQKGGEKETDNNLFLRLIVSHGILDPNLNSPEVLAAHGAISGETIVQRIFLPGEVAKIAEEIMALSGWDDQAVELEDLKN
jgi:hypothetical protein